MTAASQTSPARATPGLILGPYYPVQQPQDADHRLWRGHARPDGARCLKFSGEVIDLAAQSLAGLTVELWHADPAGRYPHPAAPESDRVDPDFLGYGRVETDAEGRFAFDSLVPGGYQAFNERRAVHLHVQITGRCERLVTQVFLFEDATGPGDHRSRAANRRERLIARTLCEDTAVLHLHWTAVLSRG